jgi:hypothetical protein
MNQEDEQGWSFASDDRSIYGECFDDDALNECEARSSPGDPGG